MEKVALTRQSLESASNAVLISLADDYGIDIPLNLDRVLIIGELLEAYSEQEEEDQEDEIYEDNTESTENSLPFTYNETHIAVMLRAPAWAFVYWDIREQELRDLQNSSNFTSLSLRVNFYDSISSTESSENFDVKISLYDRQQYILIPSGKRYFTIELLQNTTNLPPERMAITGLVRIPQGSDKVQKLQPGKQLDITELQKLSGMEEALNNLYKNHVQSFS